MTSINQDIEEQSSGGFKPDQLLDIARRRHFHFLIPLFLGWLAVWGSSWFLSPRYKSGTLILVEEQGDSHFGPVHQRRNIGGIGIAIADKASAFRRFVHSRPECPP